MAAVGAMPLAALAAAGMNTGPGEVILTMAVLSIAVTAPLGAWAISFTGKYFLAIESGEGTAAPAPEGSVNIL